MALRERACTISPFATKHQPTSRSLHVLLRFNRRQPLLHANFLRLYFRELGAGALELSFGGLEHGALRGQPRVVAGVGAERVQPAARELRPSPPLYPYLNGDIIGKGICVLC